MVKRNKLDFYDNFHRNTNIQKKVINDNNYTYWYFIKYFKKCFNDNYYKKIKILDYGCGSGSVDLYLASKGNDVVGFDISDRAIELAKQSASYLGLSYKAKFYKSTKLGQIKNIQKYDLVICLEVIEHLESDIKIIKQLYKYVKKGGYILLSTPSLNAPLYRIGMLNSFDTRVGHLRRYDVKKICNILGSLGINDYHIYKIEGVLRNMLYTNNYLGKIIKYFRGPIPYIAYILDQLLLYIFGESNLFVIIKKS